MGDGREISRLVFRRKELMCFMVRRFGRWLKLRESGFYDD